MIETRMSIVCWELFGNKVILQFFNDVPTPRLFAFISGLRISKQITQTNPQHAQQEVPIFLNIAYGFKAFQDRHLSM